MGLFGPSRRQVARMAQEFAQLEREQERDTIAGHQNPPKNPLDRSVDWLVFDGGFLPTVNGALQHSGNLGVLFCAPAVLNDQSLSAWVSRMTPNISLFMNGRVLRDALDDGWMDRAMKQHMPLSDVERQVPKAQMLFHYHFDLHPSQVSPRDIECFNKTWVDYLKSNSWDDFRTALHRGVLPGAPSWWQESPLD